MVVGVLHILKHYGAFINFGRINGILHISWINHDRISDIAFHNCSLVW